MIKKAKLSKKEQQDLKSKQIYLQAHPDDAMAASRVGFLLNKSGRGKEAADYLLKAFDNFSNSGQHSMAVMLADELLSVQGSKVEIMHRLSQMADQKDLEVPILQIYRKYKGFHQLPLFSVLNELEFLQLLRTSKYHNVKKNRIMLRHIFPNCLPALIVLFTLGIPEAIMYEACLSFLGVGAQPPTPSWGLLVSRGKEYLFSAPWVAIMPGVAILITVMAFNFMGDGLRDALDPYMKD